MGTLEQLFDLRNASALRNRVAAACWRTAKTIFQEADGTPLHAERLAWAVRILRDSGEGQPVLEIFRAAILLLENQGEQATDAEIQNAVDAIVNKFAVMGV